MARKKISGMTAASAYTGSNEFYELVQGGNTRQGSHALLKTYFDTLYGPAVEYAKLSEVQTANTNGGTFDQGAWRTRTLNTEDTDSGGIVSRSGNAFTLQAGTYRIRAAAPAYGVDRHKAKLRNTTDSEDTIIGTTEFAGTAGGTPQTWSVIVGEFSIASAKTFEVQHRCASSVSGNGFGVGANLGVSEVYTIVELWKVA